MTLMTFRDVIAAAIRAAWDEYSPNHTPLIGSAMLADVVVDVLKAEGFEVYRPGECEIGTLVSSRWVVDRAWLLRMDRDCDAASDSRFRLVPASDDTEGE